jgi:hypothetical protein
MRYTSKDKTIHNHCRDKRGTVIPVHNEFKHYAMKAYGGVDV